VAVQIKRSNPLGAMNITPVIDMVFLLLIFFLVAARIEEEDERSLEVRLPQASEALPLTARPRELYVTVNSQGQYFAGGRFRSLAELEGLLMQAAADNPGRQTVIVRADERCPWRFVVNVMNLCAKARIRDVRTTTADPESARPAAGE
jgi:biopolymer transport protein ExbD